MLQVYERLMVSVVEVSQREGRKICLFGWWKDPKGLTSSGGSRGKPPPPPPPLCLDETEAQRAEKNFRRPVPPHLPLSKGLDDRPHPISQGLNPVLTVPFYVCEKVQKTFWFCDLFIYLRQRSKNGMWKAVWENYCVIIAVKLFTWSENWALYKSLGTV